MCVRVYGLSADGCVCWGTACESVYVHVWIVCTVCVCMDYQLMVASGGEQCVYACACTCKYGVFV